MEPWDLSQIHSCAGGCFTAPLEHFYWSDYDQNLGASTSYVGKPKNKNLDRKNNFSSKKKSSKSFEIFFVGIFENPKMFEKKHENFDIFEKKLEN